MAMPEDENEEEDRDEEQASFPGLKKPSQPCMNPAASNSGQRRLL